MWRRFLVLLSYFILLSGNYAIIVSSHGTRDTPQCPANQTYVQCPNKCPNTICPENDGPQSVCDPINPDDCIPGCQCNVNYRNNTSAADQCILARECPAINCTRQNEVYDPCPSACFSEYCSDKQYENTTCNTLLENCQPRCSCKKGYFRGSDGLCIPRDECPSCPANQRYSTCVEGECGPKICKDLGKPLPCPAVSSCTKGCVCEYDYVKNCRGDCIHQTTCRKCGGDPNAVSGCGKHCTDSCPSSLTSKQTEDCKDSSSCLFNGCDCKEGYKYNGTKCVKPADCPA